MAYHWRLCGAQYDAERACGHRTNLCKHVQAPKVTEARASDQFGTNYADSPEPIYGNLYLPRKFKIAVTVPGDNSVDILTNDVGIVVITDSAGELQVRHDPECSDGGDFISLRVLRDLCGPPSPLLSRRDPSYSRIQESPHCSNERMLHLLHIRRVGLLSSTRPLHCTVALFGAFPGSRST